MEHVIRYLSWTFVFGAVATLLYTSFKPFWSELLSGEYPPEQIQGTVLSAGEAPQDADVETRTEIQLAEAVACTENRRSEDVCPQSAP